MEDVRFILLEKIEKLTASQWLWIVAAVILIGAIALWAVHYRRVEGKKGVKIFSVVALCFIGAAFLAEMITIMILSPVEYDPSALPKWLLYLFPTIAILTGSALFISGLIVGETDREPVPQKTNVRALTYGAICVASAFVLSYIKLFSAPQGGSVTLASMLPIMLYANVFGTKRGLLVGLVYGLLQFIQKPEIYHWAQVLLDYPLAFTVIGLAGLSGRLKLLPLGTVIGGFARFVVHTISGFLFFSEVLNGSALWASVVYNGWYMLFDTAICFVLAFPLAAIVKRTGIAQSAAGTE